MKKLIYSVMAISAMLAGCGETNKNPLLSDFNTPLNTPPFDKIKLEHYVPAVDAAIEEVHQDVEKIINNTQDPTFENTIEALEYKGQRLTTVALIFFNLHESETSPQMDSIAEIIQPKLTALSNDISLNPKLFERVKTVYDQTYETGDYTIEQKKLLSDTYKSFTRNGAGLNDADKEKYRAITTELANLSLKFGQNVLNDTNAFSIHIAPQDSAKIADLPAFVKDGMAQEAKNSNLEGWKITLHAPSMEPFLTYSTNRELKKELWTKYNSRAMSGETDNREIVKRMSNLRLELANLLGYETYADYILEERMAESSTNVNSFLQELLAAYKPHAQKDFETIKVYAEAQTDHGTNFVFSPWDFGYYREKYRKEKYSLDEEQIKPFLKLENVQNGVFMLANKLFGLTFKENNKIPVYHKDVKTYEVYNDAGKFMSVLYMDFFPRESKRGGAWMTSFREMYTAQDGKEVRPWIIVCCNFTKPTDTTPSLLTFREFETLLHEFGHALHGMLAEGQYQSLTGTNVYRDFVELPSQIMENWATEKEFLDMWAVHYQTGEKMPAELIEKILASKNFLTSYIGVRQLTFGICDMAWQSIKTPFTGDVEKFEDEAIKETQFFSHTPGTSFSTAFNHIFPGGYAAGYYSYKWAEVLEADAYSLFKEKGIFNKEVADSFRENILSKGGTEHPMELYLRFRGHKPETSALLKKSGIE